MFAESQDDPDLAIACGRPRSSEYNAPASLYNEVLCKFQHDLGVAKPSLVDMEAYHILRHDLCLFFDDNHEGSRRRIVSQVIGPLLGELQRPVRGTAPHTFRTDGDICHPVRLPGVKEPLDLLIYMQIIKDETRSSSSNAFIEACCCYKEYIRTVHEKDLKAVCGFPTIILLHFGA